MLVTAGLCAIAHFGRWRTDKWRRSEPGATRSPACHAASRYEQVFVQVTNFVVVLEPPAPVAVSLTV